MSYRLKVIKDNPVGFWMLDEAAGSTIALDYSGCNNNGIYQGTSPTNILPLVPGGGAGTKITNLSYIHFPVSKGYYSDSLGGGMATKDSSDNDFSLECWIHQSIESP
jgi:hypothetical protein